MDKLLDEALRLPPRERADLAARLIASLDTESDADAEQAWDDEILRRVGELDRGEVKPIPWPVARRKILGEPDAPGP